MQTITTDKQRKIRKIELEHIEKEEEIKLKESKKNKNFIQITDPHGLIAMRAIYSKSKVAGDLFYFMMQYMDRKNALICSMKLFSEALNKSYRSIQRAVKLLADNNYILVSKVGTINAYHLNSSICWKSWGTGKAYAKLRGNVLLSLSEQEENIQKKVSKQLTLFK